jgi:hypothetical protein
VQLRSLLALLIIGLAVGVGGWWGYQTFFLTSNKNVRSIQSNIPGTSQDPKAKVTVFVPSFEVTTLQDPFFTSPCFWSTTAPCLLQHSRYNEINNIEVYPYKPGEENIGLREFSFTAGRLFGQSDNLKRYFVQQGQSERYFPFVAQMMQQSFDHGINPAVVYFIYDAVAQQIIGRGEIEVELPSPIELTNQIDRGMVFMTKNISPPDEFGQQIYRLDWTKEGRALLYGLAWTFPDSAIVTAVFQNRGSLDTWYVNHINGDFAEKIFEVQIGQGEVSSTEFFAGGQEDWQLAMCRNTVGYVCTDFVPGDGRTATLPCRYASVLSEVCERLPNF